MIMPARLGFWLRVGAKSRATLRGLAHGIPGPVFLSFQIK